MTEGILEEVLMTVNSVNQLINKLPPEEQKAVMGYLDKANKALGEVRDSLAKARAIAGINAPKEA